MPSTLIEHAGVQHRAAGRDSELDLNAPLSTPTADEGAADDLRPSELHTGDLNTGDLNTDDLRTDDLPAVYRTFGKVSLSWKSLDWTVVVWMAGMHLGALAAPFFFTWQAAVTALVLHWLTASIGICLAYHRYLTHRSFKLRQPADFLVTLCGVLAGEGTPLQWCAVHRLHHKRSDHHGDPHSPLEGPWWAHLWWMFTAKTPEDRAMLYRRFIPELSRRPLLHFFEKTFILWQIASGVALYAIGGLPMLLWGLCARMVFCYHSTWFVNSATHLWGYRNYKTRDESRNLWWVAILAYGEGWHNNHHAHPANARAGHRWWEFDPTFWAIRALQLVGQAYDVKDQIPAPESQTATDHSALSEGANAESTKPETANAEARETVAA